MARLALDEAGIAPATVSAKTGFAALFPEIVKDNKPSPLQSHADTCSIAQAPQLYILEDVTGSGKTEAALTLAHRMMVDDLAEGVFVALPTMATANQMYDRMVKSYEKLFTAESKPSLVLVHATRHLSPKFRQSILKQEAKLDETATVHCSAVDRGQPQENAACRRRRRHARSTSDGDFAIQASIAAVIWARRKGADRG